MSSAPIGCTEDQVALAESLFTCPVVEFLIKYLGIPLFVTKLPKAALHPLVDWVADKLPMWKGNLMQRSSRLVLIRTTLSAIPTYTAISIDIPPWLHKALRRIMTAFLCTGSDVVSGGKCLIVWSQVQRLLPLRVLGVLDLSYFGTTLKLRWLWLQFMDSTRPWLSLPIKEDPATLALF
jgi:hypothetical protein